MARNKTPQTRLSVFKGREAKLNKAIFQTLAQKEPQTIYDVHKLIRTQKGMRNTKYTNVFRRMKALEESSYLEKAGTRKVRTQPGMQAMLYRLTSKAHLALVLSKSTWTSISET